MALRRSWRCCCVIAVLALACGPTDEVTPSAVEVERDSEERPSVLLLGIDGADWAVMDPLIAAGALPHLGAIVARGARADLDCYPAMPETACFCPPVWVSIATGQPYARHGVATIHHGSKGRGVAAIWNALASHGGRSTLVAFRNSWPPEPDVTYVLTEPGLDMTAAALYDVYPAPAMSPPNLAKAYHARPEGLFEELGLVPHAGERPRVRNMIARDRVAMEALLRLARRDRTDLTAVILHSPDKSSHLYWASIQPTPEAPVDGARVREIAASFRGPVEGEGAVSGESVTSQYQEADAWLGRLLAEVDYDTVVLASDHGMTRRRGYGLPGVHNVAHPEAHQGIFAIAGPGVRGGVTLEGVTVLDVAPTLAYALGIPISEDLAGRFLAEAFEPAWLEAHPPRRVATWPRKRRSARASGEHSSVQIDPHRDVVGAQCLGPDEGFAHVAHGCG